MEQISPELALVDPELAADARAALPERPWPAPVPVVVRQRRRRRRRRAVFAVPLLAAVLGALVLVGARDEPDLSTAAAPPVAPGAGPAAPEEPPSAPTPPPTQRSQPAPPPAPQPSPQPTRAPAVPPKPPPPPAAGGTKPKPATPPPSRSKAPAGAPRVYVWDAAPRAVYYDVALVRDGRPVHVVQTEDPWLRLPPSLELPAGTYRLTVRPALVGDTGVALGGAIVQRTFTVARG